MFPSLPSSIFLREHPFNMKGGGGYGFVGGGGISVSKFDGIDALWENYDKLALSKKFSESTLCLKNYCFCGIKTML